MDIKLSSFATEKTSSSVEPQSVKVLIIGAGPAGMAAALYSARAELNPVVITGTELGGQAAITHTIENYPGFPEGVGGSALSESFQKQAEHFGAVFEIDTVTSVDFSSRPYQVKTYSKEFLAESVIISTGASPNHLNVPGENLLIGRGVSYCATCDGWFFRGKNVMVVGGGDSALEEAVFLTRYAASVTIIHRRDTLRAGIILQKRAMENPKIKFIWNSVITEVIGKDGVESVRLKNVKTGEEQIQPTDGVFIFIGHTPNTDLFKETITMENGYILTDKYAQTNLPGIYAAGEAADPHFRQVITSAGMGAAAAIQATHFLEEHS
jgi:thioredoxin reductase (NADPH)